MKIKILVFILVISAFFTGCDSVKVPEAIQTSFGKTFPDAQDVSWKKEKPLKYEASFVINGTQMSASYNEDGKWLETSQTIKQLELPGSVQSVLDSVYSDYEVASTYRVEKPENNILYKVALKNGAVQKEILFSENGKVSQINTIKTVNAKD